MLGRNVLNEDEIRAKLQPILSKLEDRPEDRQWLEKKARRWIIRHHGSCGRVVAICRGAPARIRVDWGGGRATTHRFNLPEWYRGETGKDLHWLDLTDRSARRLFADLAILAEAILGDLPELMPNKRRRADLPDLLKVARQWAGKRRLEEQAVMHFDDGCRVMPLTRRDDFVYEGKSMGHCVADYWYNNPENTEILSLRTAQNKPYVTFEVYRGREIWQIRGRHNREVDPRYRPHVAQMIRELDLLPLLGPPWKGFQYRGFAADDPASWVHRAPDLKDRRDRHRFMIDLEAAIDSLDTETLDRCLDHLRGPNGNFIDWQIVERHDVYGLTIPVLTAVFPWRLYNMLSRAKSPDRRRRARELRENLEKALSEQLSDNPVALIDITDLDDMVRKDLSRQRQRHHAALRRRMAKHQMDRARQSSFDPRQIECWEAGRAAVLKLMDTAPERYL